MAEKISKIEILDIEKTIGKKLLQDYIQIIQNKVTNTLTTLNKKSFKEVDEDGIGKIEKDGIVVFLQDIEKVRLDAITWKVLYFLSEKVNDNFNKYGVDDLDNVRTINLNVKEYAELCGINSLPTARNQLIESVQAISRIRLSFMEPIYNEKTYGIKEYINHDIALVGDVVTLLDRKQVLKDLKAFKFSTDFIKYMLRKKYILNIPKSLFSINTKLNPNSLYLASKLLEYANINKIKENESFIIGVRSLVLSTPELKKYEDIKKKGQIFQRIIEPFKRDMDELVEKGILESWSFCNSKGAELTATQKKMADYETFEALFIECKLKK